jgi:sugar O-acyltransferase (sialic acid O-acetyltransferase NeuD family)
MRRIGIFGTSGMAREVGDIVRSLNYQPVYVARVKSDITIWKHEEDIILEHDVERHHNMQFVIGIGDNAVRKRIADRFRSSLSFTNLIHPSATFGWQQREIIAGCAGVIVCAGARLTSGIKVGDFVIFNQNVTIAHDTAIGDFVHLAPQVCISGNVDIGAGVWMGAGSVVKQGMPEKRLSIGAATIIGAGAVVVSDCDSNAVYVGVPAKRVK